MALQGYKVERISFSDTVRSFLRKWHYSDYVNIQAKEVFGLFRDGAFLPEMVGVCIYTRPAGPTAAQKYYNEIELDIYDGVGQVMIEDRMTGVIKEKTLEKVVRVEYSMIEVDDTKLFGYK